MAHARTRQPRRNPRNTFIPSVIRQPVGIVTPANRQSLSDWSYPPPSVSPATQQAMRTFRAKLALQELVEGRGHEN